MKETKAGRPRGGKPVFICGIENPRNFIDPLFCENWENHTPCPDGYVQWHEWADAKSKTHMQIKCEGCGLYKIWVKSTTP